MAVYSVFEPPERSNDAADDAERFAFVRDGFSWAAFAFGMYVDGFDGGVEGWAWFLFAVLVGLEASSLRRWTLTRRGWNDLGIVVADDLEAAERRFFAAWASSDRDQPWPAA